MKLLRLLAQKHGVATVVSKLVFFPRKSLFDDYFGNGWKSTCSLQIAIEDVKMTLAALGKTGQRAVGFMSESEQPDKRCQFLVAESGCVFAK